jgi:hypothetical protein
MIIEASVKYFEAQVLKHRTNIETMLANPIAIPEHTNIMESIEQELGRIAEYEDKLEVLSKYFVDK